MSLALSEDDRAYVQRMTGISDQEAVMTDAELDSIYTRFAGDIDLTVIDVWYMILADAAKMTSYQNGLQREDLSDVHKHILQNIAIWEDRVAGRASLVGMRMTGLRSVPKKHPERPWNRREPRGRERRPR